MSNDRLSRRKFFKTAAKTSVALPAASLLGVPALAASPGNYPDAQQTPTGFDFTKQSPALQADKVVDSACQFCNSLCRLKVHLKDGRIIEVRGELDDPVQAGGLCVKGETMMTQLVYNRFRLTKPMKRVAGEKGSADSRFEPVSWDEALEIIAKKFLALRDAGEARAIANKTSGRLPRGTGSVVARFFTLLGSPNDTDVGPVCNDAGGNALAWTFGLGNFTNGYGKDESTGKEDLGAAKFFLFLGTNQAETHPVTFAYLLRHRAKTKAKLVVIDPRLTPTGAQADDWIAPKPHTDLAHTKRSVPQAARMFAGRRRLVTLQSQHEIQLTVCATIAPSDAGLMPRRHCSWARQSGFAGTDRGNGFDSGGCRRHGNVLYMRAWTLIKTMNAFVQALTLSDLGLRNSREPGSDPQLRLTPANNSISPIGEIN